mgnify:CR=1 FL=1
MKDENIAMEKESEAENDVYIILWNSLIKPLLNDPFPKNAKLARYLLLKTIRDRAYQELGREPKLERNEHLSSVQSPRKRKKKSLTRFLKPGKQESKQLFILNR